MAAYRSASRLFEGMHMSSACMRVSACGSTNPYLQDVTSRSRTLAWSTFEPITSPSRSRFSLTTHNDLSFPPRRAICGKHMPNCCVAVSGTSSHSVQHRPTCIQRARHYSVQAMQVRKCQISQLKGSHTHTHTHTHRFFTITTFADSKRPRRCSAGHSPSATPMDSR